MAVTGATARAMGPQSRTGVASGARRMPTLECVRRMLTAEWYYLEPYVDGDDVEVCVVADDDSIVGPLKLSEIADRVRVGRLPDDVKIGRDREHFEYAVCVPEYLRALPVVRERIVEEYLYYGSVEKPEWGRASTHMFHINLRAPEIAWGIVIELIDRAPSEKALGYFAAGPLEDLLSEHGPALIDRVEQRARENPKFLRAVRCLWRLGMTDDVWDRVQLLKVAADSNG